MRDLNDEDDGRIDTDKRLERIYRKRGLKLFDSYAEVDLDDEDLKELEEANAESRRRAARNS